MSTSEAMQRIFISNPSLFVDALKTQARTTSEKEVLAFRGI